MKMYVDYKLFFTTLKFQRAVASMEEAAEGRETPFAMTDWKIISIFIAWMSLLGIDLLVFSIELVVSKMVGKSKVQSVVIKFCRSTFLSLQHRTIAFQDSMLVKFKCNRIFKRQEYNGVGRT